MRRVRDSSAALLILMGLAAADAAALEPHGPDLITDRPDQTESAVVVPIGTAQVETGALFTFDEEKGIRSQASEVPGTLLRFGLHPRVELRVGWSGWIEDVSRGAGGRSRVSEAADPELGVKIALAKARGARPDVALIAHASLPVGGETVGSPRADPWARLSVAHTLSDRVGLGWNIEWGAASFRDAIGQVHTLTRFGYTASVGVDLAERWGAFIEIFGDLPASDPAPAAHSLDAGVTILIAPRVQLDLAAGVGLNSDAPDRFIGCGISFRLPR